MRHLSLVAGLITGLGMAPLAATAQTADPVLPLPVTDESFIELNPLSVALGRNLFYDPILSGNRNIACATCHHPAFGTSDGMSLSMGEGGVGLGPLRSANPANAPVARIPRNAPALFNLGATEFTVMFHDGRVQKQDGAPMGFRMPLGRALERPVRNALSAQAMLPVLSPDEMAGHPGENEIADAVADGLIRGDRGAWALLAARVGAIAEYRAAFDKVLGPGRPIHFSDIAMSIADFIAFEFRATNSPFDAYLGGDVTALDASAKRGMDLFYGQANCSSCHAGPFQTDQSFYAIAVPQFGPGKGSDHLFYGDSGREMVTGAPEDMYRFRTPSLRNVAATAPYGHDGAFATLDAMIRHHADPLRSLALYNYREARLHEMKVGIDDTLALNDLEELLRIAAASEIRPVSLSDADVADLVAFLQALTDPTPLRGRLGVPRSVPSGLALDTLPPT